MTDARFTLRLDADLKDWLEAEARRQDRSAGWVAKRAIETLKRTTEARRKMIADAIEDAEKGVFVSQGTVHDWMRTWDTETEAPVPAPDLVVTRT